MTITEFLAARVAEDEALARAAMATVTPDAWENSTSCGNFYTDDIAFWDSYTPSRVLAECAAKRAIIAEHPRDDDGFCYDSITHMHGCKWEWPCPSLRAIAAIYKDHTDYKQEWTT